MTTRSAVLAAGEILGRVPTTVFTGPASTVTLLKDIKVLGLDAESHEYIIQIHRQIPTVYAWLLVDTIVGPATLDWTGWVVLEAGDQLLIDSQGGHYFYWVSGALLPARPL